MYNSKSDFVILGNGYLYKYVGTSENVVIPSNVITIGDKAFFENESIKSVVIPDGVTVIKDSAFNGCINIDSVVFPESLRKIENEAFSFCTSLKELHIPHSVEVIGRCAFSYCDGLTSLVIPEGVKTIEFFAFSFCESLTSVTIPDSVTDVGQEPFASCRNLSYISLPARLADFDWNFDEDVLVEKREDTGNAADTSSNPEKHTSKIVYKFVEDNVDFFLDSEKYNVTEIPVDDEQSAVGKVLAVQTDDGIYTFYAAVVEKEEAIHDGEKGGLQWANATEALVTGYQDSGNEVKYYSTAGKNAILIINHANEDYTDYSERDNTLQIIININYLSMLVVSLTIKAKSENGEALHAIAHNEDLTDFGEIIKTYYRELLAILSSIRIRGKFLDLRGTTPGLLMKNIDLMVESESDRDNVETVIGGTYKYNDELHYDMPDNFKAIRKISENGSPYVKMSYADDFSPEINDSELEEDDRNSKDAECSLYAIIVTASINEEDHSSEELFYADSHIFEFVDMLGDKYEEVIIRSENPEIRMGVCEPFSEYKGHILSHDAIDMVLQIHYGFLKVMNIFFFFSSGAENLEKHERLFCDFVENLLKSVRTDTNVFLKNRAYLPFSSLPLSGFSAQTVYKYVFEQYKSFSGFRITAPDESLFQHYNYIHSHSNALSALSGIGMAVSINSNGTEYELRPLREIADDIDYDEDENASEKEALYRRIVRSDTSNYELDRKAEEMNRLFHVNSNVFDPAHDRECELEYGLIKKAYMMSALRSFAWTLSAYCEDNKCSISSVDTDSLKNIVRFVSNRKWLNYEGDSYCKGLCSISDINAYYVPDSSLPNDKKQLFDMLFKNSMKNDFLNFMNTGELDEMPEMPAVASLDELRKNLEAIYPAIRKLWDELKKYRNSNVQLEGNEADIVYAWCALARAAKEPFVTQDGPMNYYYDQP
ncbi:MAG: leucine-rich repeat domain-containing protein [Ruminiclostridium sp.]|nr:leucine-rich repeat domain-containing protein [Ruminiclostridium sp.]